MHKLILRAAAIICFAICWKTTAIAQAPSWSVNPANYANSMNVTAQVYLDNVEQNGSTNLLAAFVGSEVRGVASPVIIGGKAYYYLTIYSNIVTGETVEFKVFLAAPNSIHPAAETTVFVKNAQLGGYPNGYALHLTALNDFGISLLPIPADTTLSGYPFEGLDLDPYLVSVDNDPVVWSVVNGAHISGTIGAGNVLTVTPNNPTWTGTGSLLVTATEVTANAYSASQYVLFKINPDYGVPVFDYMPVQFVQDDVPLPSGDLDNILDFNGPCLEYSVEMMLPEGTVAMPVWVQPGTNTGSMNLVVSADFGGDPISGASNKLAGFVNGQLAGVASPQMVAGKELCFLTLANVGAGAITFKFYDAANEYLHEKGTGLSFVPTGTVGDINNPHVVDFAPFVVNLLPDGSWTTTILDSDWAGEQHALFIVEDCEYGDKVDSLEVVFLINLCPSEIVELPAGFGLCLQADAGVSDVQWYMNGLPVGEGPFFGALEPGVYHYEGLTALGCPDFKSCPVFVTMNTSPAPSGNLPTAPKGATLPPTPPCGQISLVAIIVDETPPTAICKAATLYLDINGAAVLTPANVDDNSFTNCGAGILSISQEDFGCQHHGPNSVILTILDAAGRTDNCTATVTVVDNLPPIVVCKNATATLNAVGSYTLLPATVFQSASDNCGATSLISVTPNQFGCNNPGANTVTLTIQDLHGNNSTCTATLTINGYAPPTPVCSNLTLNLGADGQAAITAAQVGGNSTAACGPVSISAAPLSFSCANKGPNMVTVTATDLAGGVSTCSAIVTINDATAPMAHCKNITVPLNPDGSLTLTAAQVNNGSTDNCGVTSISIPPTNYSCANIGANMVTLTVKDASNNQSTCTAIVTIPAFLVINSVFVTNSLCGLGNGSIVVNATTSGGQLGYSINGGGTFQFSNTFSNLTPGEYTITLVAFGTANCLAYTGTLTIGTGGAANWFKDTDNDGYSTGDSLVGCSQPAGYKLLAHLSAAPLGNNVDCNDANASIYPGALELCNGIDEDCNGLAESPSNTWTGLGNGTLWSDPANWSDGIVPLACQHVIVPTGKVVIVPAGFHAVGQTLDVQLSADLTVELTGTMEIEN